MNADNGSGIDWGRVQVVIELFKLQSSGQVPARSDGKPLEVLLVESGLSQSDVGRLLGRTQQAVSLSVNKFKAKGA